MKVKPLQKPEKGGWYQLCFYFLRRGGRKFIEFFNNIYIHIDPHIRHYRESRVRQRKLVLFAAWILLHVLSWWHRLTKKPSLRVTCDASTYYEEIRK